MTKLNVLKKYNMNLKESINKLNIDYVLEKTDDK